MKLSLAVKLIMAFLVVSISGVVLAIGLAGQFTEREFDRLLREQIQEGFIDQITAYYKTHSTWDGIGAYMRDNQPSANLGTAPTRIPWNMRGPRNAPPQGQSTPHLFMLVDTNGKVLIPGNQYRTGDSVAPTDLRNGMPVIVDGEGVGTLVNTAIKPIRNPFEQAFLERTQGVLLFATGVAVIAALVLGVILTQNLTRPLRELTGAIDAVAAGDLGQHVQVRSNDELGELANAFNKMSDDLVEATDLRRRMTADIAHDLRSPLTVITGYLEALRDGDLQPTQPRLDVMYDEAQHLLRLVEDLRTLSLADAGELTLNRIPVAPCELLRRLFNAYEHLAQQKQLTLEITCAPNLPTIFADPERLIQILGNLVNNALRYTPACGKISLSALSHDGALSFQVADSGQGIAQKDITRIFERFYRGDAAREQTNGETGLGLAIAKSLTEAHNGTISATSTVGEGSTFTITLPTAVQVVPTAVKHKHTSS